MDGLDTSLQYGAPTENRNDNLSNNEYLTSQVFDLGIELQQLAIEIAVVSHALARERTDILSSFFHTDLPESIVDALADEYLAMRNKARDCCAESGPLYRVFDKSVLTDWERRNVLNDLQRTAFELRTLCDPLVTNFGESSLEIVSCVTRLTDFHAKLIALHQLEYVPSVLDSM